MQKIVLGAMLSLLIFTGCKKDSPAPTTYPIQGLWVGSYTDLNATLYFSFSVYPDGTLSYKSIFDNTTVFSSGTWNLTDTTFTFTTTAVNYPPNVTQSGTATYNKSKGTLVGSGADQAQTDPFTFTLTKVN